MLLSHRTAIEHKIIIRNNQVSHNNKGQASEFSRIQNPGVICAGYVVSPYMLGWDMCTCVAFLNSCMGGSRKGNLHSPRGMAVSPLGNKVGLFRPGLEGGRLNRGRVVGPRRNSNILQVKSSDQEMYLEPIFPQLRGREGERHFQRYACWQRPVQGSQLSAEKQLLPSQLLAVPGSRPELEKGRVGEGGTHG